MSEWISVKDRLPEIPEDKFCVICPVVWEREGRQYIMKAKYEKTLDKKVNRIESINSALKKSKKCRWLVCSHPAKYITHWLQLPPLPPKDEREEQTYDQGSTKVWFC